MAYAPQIQSAAQNGAGHLILTFDNGSTLDAGSDTGATGATGTSVTSATINTAGHLIITKSDGTTSDAGAVPGAGGYPLLVLTAATGNTSYSLKSTDLVGAFLYVVIDATNAAFTFTVDAALLYGGTSTPTTTKVLIIKRLDNVTANTVTVAAAPGETVDTLASTTEAGYASLNVSATSNTRLVRW